MVQQNHDRAVQYELLSNVRLALHAFEDGRERQDSKGSGERSYTR